MSAEIETKGGRELVPRTASITGFAWKPQPLEMPKVHPELLKMDSVTRSAEMIRYSARAAEYWLSPDGRLREWFRLCLFIAMVLGIPALLLFPIVTLVLTSAAQWVALVLQIVQGLALIAGCVFAIATGVRFFIARTKR